MDSVISTAHDNIQLQPAKFSHPKTVEERKTIKHFGKASDIEHNQKCTTYGDDVFMELNPLIFLGNKGLAMVNKYQSDVISALAKENPTLPPRIILKELQGSVVEANSKPATIIDWWSDNINDYITNTESGDCSINAGNTVSKPFENIQPALLDILIPEVMDKLDVINNLILAYRPMLNQQQQQQNAGFAGFAGGGLELDNTNSSIQVQTAEFKLETKTNTTGLFMPVKTNRISNYDNIVNQSNDNNTHKHTDRVFYDDNCALKISNFVNMDMMDVYYIKDMLRDNGLDSNLIKYKITMPKDKVSRQHKDFIFLNFCNMTDLDEAFNILSAKRIVNDCAILSIEKVNKNKAG